MASASTRKQCANNDDCKQAGIAYCEGCSHTFCGKHFNDHRRLLGEELNVIFSDCNEVKDTLNQQLVKPDSHPLIKQIDEWEHNSIASIQQRAKELREQLLQLGTVHRSELSQKLRQLSEQSNEAHEHDSFSETDLHQWKKTLEDLKADLASPPRISVHLDDNFPLVQNIFVHLLEVAQDVFERVSSGNVRIEENKQVVSLFGPLAEHREIRGRNEYASGSHQIRLGIEESSNTWILLGINSKSTPLKNESYKCKSTYGWASDNKIWSYGQEKQNNSKNAIEIKKGDIISLIFNCDEQLITMINERTNMKYELLVNLTYCPLPWQLHINLNEANTRIRILSN
jgi:hypothetical protein